MIDKIHCQFKVGNDIHKPLIAMFQAIQNGWDFPMHISEEEYIHVRDNKTKFSFPFLKTTRLLHSFFSANIYILFHLWYPSLVK